MILKIQLLTDIFPIKLEYKTKHAAGFDLQSTIKAWLEPGERLKVPCGFAIEIPEGFEGNIRPRSGIAMNEGLIAVEGTIDADYRGELSVILVNTDYHEKKIEICQRIAQMVISPVIRCEFEYVKDLSPTERGNKGFGSTGVF